MSTPEERFFAKVMKTPTCWLWTAARTLDAHGVFGVGKTSTSAHRWSYEYYVGAIPPGYQIDHLCRVRPCVNPAHLEAVTPAENARRAWRARALLADRRRGPINLDWPGFLAEFASEPRTRQEVSA